jgi:hypothetical protein
MNEKFPWMHNNSYKDLIFFLKFPNALLGASKTKYTTHGFVSKKLHVGMNFF